jgi:hypothetical protein
MGNVEASEKEPTAGKPHIGRASSAGGSAWIDMKHQSRNVNPRLLRRVRVCVLIVKASQMERPILDALNTRVVA